MDTQTVGGKRRQQKSNDTAKQQRKTNLLEQVIGGKHYLGNHRGKRSTVQRNIDVFGKRFAVDFGKKINTENDRPDVGDVFAEHGKSRHQKSAGDGGAVYHSVAGADNQKRCRHDKSGIEQHGTKSADAAVVGNQSVRMEDDFDKPFCNFAGGLKTKCKHHHANRR